MFDIDLFIYQVQQLLNDRDMTYRKYCDDICDHCINKVDCKPKECIGYISGSNGFLDGKPVKFKWDCRDFDYGTCPIMEKTPCFNCFENEYSGFQYNGTNYDFSSALDQLKALYEKLKSNYLMERNDMND